MSSQQLHSRTHCSPCRASWVAAHPGSITVATSSTTGAVLPASPPLFLADLILPWCNSGRWADAAPGWAVLVGGCLSKGRWGRTRRMHPMLSHPMLSHAGVIFPAPIDLIGQSRTWQLESKVPIFQTQTGRFINRKNIQSPSPSKACNLFYSRQPNFI